jgi:hypothetical protein
MKVAAGGLPITPSSINPSRHLPLFPQSITIPLVSGAGCDKVQNFSIQKGSEKGRDPRTI